MKSLEIFVANVCAKHQKVMERWRLLLIGITKGEKTVGIRSVKDFSNALQELGELIQHDGLPEWFVGMRDASGKLSKDRYFSDDGTRQSLFLRMLSDAPQMQSYRIEVYAHEDATPMVDLDEIISRHHDKEKINEYYARAIKHIRDALDSGDIDSKRVSKDLARILASIEATKGSSFFSQIFQVKNLKGFLTEVSVASAKRIPILGDILSIITEAQNELDDTNEKILDEVRKISAQQANFFNKAAGNLQPILTDDSDQNNVIDSTAQRVEDNPIDRSS